jgi:hypothetical protein
MWIGGVAPVTETRTGDPRWYRRRTAPMVALRSWSAGPSRQRSASVGEPPHPSASLEAMGDRGHRRRPRAGAMRSRQRSASSTMTLVSQRSDRAAVQCAASTPQSRHGAPAMEQARSRHASVGDARRGREVTTVYACLASVARGVIPRDGVDEEMSSTCASSTTRYTHDLAAPLYGAIEVPIGESCSGWTGRNRGRGRLCLTPEHSCSEAPRPGSRRNLRVKDLGWRHMTQQVQPVRRQLPDGLADAAPPSSNAIVRNGSAPRVHAGGAIPTTGPAWSATRRNPSRLAGTVGRDDNRIALRRRSPRTIGCAREAF